MSTDNFALIHPPYWDRSTRVDVTSEPVGVTYAPLSGMLDAFGRLRVSEPYTIFDSKQIFDDADIANTAENLPDAYDNQEVSGSGTSTAFSALTASTTLSVSDTTAGKRVRQSKRRMNYQPGKSQRAFLTGVLGVTTSGLAHRYGLFDDDNGLFFQSEDGAVSVVRRTNVTGTPVDNAVPQHMWNIDRMDGNGDSGIILNWNATQILYIDFEWLGVGTVRFGVVIDGVIYYIHQMNHANTLTDVYMSNPNLPVRAEIENDGTGAASSIKMICASVDSEGGLHPQGRTRSKNTGVTPIALASNATKYPILGIRLRSTHLGLHVILEALTVVITSTNDTLLWELHLNPTLSAGLTYSNIGNSGLQGAVGNGTITVTGNGIVLASGFTKDDSVTALPADLAESLGSAIDGTPDALVLVCQPVVNSTNVLASLDWRELM